MCVREHCREFDAICCIDVSAMIPDPWRLCFVKFHLVPSGHGTTERLNSSFITLLFASHPLITVKIQVHFRKLQIIFYSLCAPSSAVNHLCIDLNVNFISFSVNFQFKRHIFEWNIFAQYSLDTIFYILCLNENELSSCGARS